MKEAIELNVPPFGLFELVPSEEKIAITASVKKNGSLYFLSTAIKRNEDGSPRPTFMSNRIETFTGKPVRGKMNAPLETLMDLIHEKAIAWAVEHWPAPSKM